MLIEYSNNDADVQFISNYFKMKILLRFEIYLLRLNLEFKLAHHFDLFSLQTSPDKLQH